MLRAYKPTSFRFPPDLKEKIEELAKAKTKELGIQKKLTKSDIVSILVQEAYEKLNKAEKN